MKNFLRSLIFFAAALVLPPAAMAQSPQLIYSGQFSGPSNVLSGASFTFNSGSSLQLQFGTTGANRLVIETNSSGLVGTVGLGSGLSISGGNLVAGSSSSANPTGKVGPTATNGVLTTYMTSDSAPAIDLTATYPWTGLHSFSPTAVKTSGTDYGIEVTPTLNQRNATNFILIFGNETITQAGTGNQYLEELQVSGTDKWLIDSTGTVKTGIWTGTAIGQNYGGAGTINGPLQGNGSGVVSLATGGTGIAVSSGGIAITSLVVTNSGLSLPANALVLGNGSPDTKVANGLVTDGISKIFVGAAGASVGNIVFANATSGTLTLAPVTGALGSNTILLPAASGTLQLFSGSSTTNDVPSFSNSSGSIQDPGVAAINGQQFQINSTGVAGTVAFALVNSTTGTPQPLATMFAPNMGTGNPVSLEIGQTANTGNAGIFSFYYNGNNNASNAFTWSFNGGGTLMYLQTGGLLDLQGTIASTSTSTGTLVLSGSGAGLGVAGAGWFGGTVNSVNLSITNGATAATIQGALNLGGTAYTYGAASASGGSALVVPATTYTLTGGSPANFQAVYLGIPTFTDSTTGTMTNGATLTINGAPVAAGSLTITNKYALQVNNGQSFFSGLVYANGGINETFASPGPGYTGVLISTNTSSSGDSRYGFNNDTGGALVFDFTGSTYAGTILGQTGALAAIWTYLGENLYIGTSGTLALTINTSQNLLAVGKFSAYQNVNTAGWGVPAIYGEGRTTGATGATASVATYTCGAADGSFEVSSNVNVTSYTSGTFTVTVTYHDEGNTSRTLTMNFSTTAGVLGTAVAAAGAFEGVPLHIRCKASTAITVATTGTFTSLTYDVEGVIKQTG